MNVALKQFWLSGTWGRPPVSQTVEVSDQTKSADSAGTAAAFIRSLTDAVKPTDQSVNIASFIRALADSSKAADRCESIAAFIKALYDASKATDSIDKTAYYIRSITETTLALDTLAKVASYIRASADISRAADTLTKELSLATSDTYKAADVANRVIAKTLEDLAKASDPYEKTASLVRELEEIVKAIDQIEKAAYIKPKPAIPYTQRYGLTYDQWAEERAKRIRECLEKFYTSNAAVDLQTLAEQIYRERLKKFSKLSWMPVKGAFTDFKPSPFIKNFLTYLINRLIEDGYIMQGWRIEAYERARASDQTLEASKTRIYRIGIKSKIVEVAEAIKTSEPSLETQLQPIKITQYPLHTYIEIREATHVSDTKRAIEVSTEPPATKATYAKRVLKIPSLEYLKDLCTWKEP
jgi:cell fate (sporulation/competence/biofilm development) regulator YlbF (YheA/YmcA/DUF963 family)